MGTDRAGGDPTPRAGDGGAYRKTPTQLATDPAFTGTYAPWASAGPTLFGVIGDSTVAGGLQTSDAVTVNVANQGTAVYPAAAIGYERGGEYAWPTFLAAASAGALILNHNGGCANDTSTGCLTRLAYELSLKPRVMFLQMGVVNDIGNSVPLSTTKTNIATAVTQVKAAGVLPILVTIFPTGTTGNQPTVRAYNEWLKGYGLRNGITVVDPFGAVVDPTTAGAWTTSMAQDGLHPTSLGAQTAAAAILAQLQARGIAPGTSNPAAFPFLANVYPGASVNAADNLLKNPLFNGGNTAGVATSWSLPNGGTGTIDTTPGTGIAGYGQVVTAGTNNVALRQDVTVDGTVLRAGDRVAFSGLFKATGNAANGNNYSIARLNSFGTPVNTPYWAQNIGLHADTGATKRSVDFTAWTPFYLETTLQAGATLLRVEAVALQSSPVTGSVFEFAMMRLANLTLLGVA